MADPVTYDDNGLERYLEGLGGSLGFLAVEGGVQAQGRPIVKSMKSTTAFEDRRLLGLRDSIKLRKTTQRQRSRAETAPGRGLALFNINADYHAFLVEFGHGGERGPAAPHPFIEPAILNTLTEQRRAFERRFIKTAERLAQQSKTGTLSKRALRYQEIEAD